MSPVIRALVAVIVALVVLAAGDEVSAKSKCNGNKMKAAAKKAASKLSCHAKAVTKGLGVDATCLAKAENKFSSAFAKANAKKYKDDGCLSTEDTVPIEVLADEFVEAVVARLSGGASPTIRVNDDVTSNT